MTYINYWYIVVKQILYLDVGTYTLDLGDFANWEYYLNNDNNNYIILLYDYNWLRILFFLHNILDLMGLNWINPLILMRRGLYYLFLYPVFIFIPERHPNRQIIIGFL